MREKQFERFDRRPNKASLKNPLDIVYNSKDEYAAVGHR